MKFYPLTICDLRRETAECVSVAFEITPDLHEIFSFKAGQYLTLRTVIDGEEVRRSYSICSSPTDNELRIAIKQIEDGKFSTFANQHLKKGDVLEVMPPMGNFTTIIDPKHAKQYIFVAVGSGITPIFSLIKTILQTEPNSICTLIYGNRNAASVIFREKIEGFKNAYLHRFQVFHVLSRERIDNDLNFGRLSFEKLSLFFDKINSLLRGDDFFVCGPVEVVEALKNILHQKNIDAKKVHFELFNAPTQKTNKKIVNTTAQSLVKIKMDGLTFEVPTPEGMSILDAAQMAGADLPFACKGGVCCTCRAKLMEGEVAMDVNFALTEDETEQGFILTCQAIPKTKNLLVDFDIK